MASNTVQRREGVTESVNASMDAVDANVLCEDGLLLRTCTHGIRHPVGHLHRALRREGETSDLAGRHESKTATGVKFEKCDGCCDEWHEARG